MLQAYFANHPLHVHHVTQFPTVDDREAWTSISPEDREELLDFAAQWRDVPYPMLTLSMIAAYIRNGSRQASQEPYFARRSKLCAAALHVCVTGEDTDLSQVEDGLWCICEETVWAVSAHAMLSEEHPFPSDQLAYPILDLFAAMTGMILSFVCQLLENRLHPDLLDRVRREIERRVLRPFMENDDEWWMGFHRRKRLNNWTTWIISNVLMTANVWQYGGDALVERACLILDRWIGGVPEDGGCDEGVAYWNMAGGAYLDCLQILEMIAGVHLWDQPKIQRVMAYPERVYLKNGWFANFADCDARPYISSERLQYAGEKTGNATLVRMGIEMRSGPIYEFSDIPHLSRLLMRLFSTPAAPMSTDPSCKDVWMPDMQIRLLESPENPGMLAAMKGGCNAESHNHNDVGTFLLMANGEMQVVDAGNLVYTAQTFSRKRYELWNCRSAYHNVPIIGDYEQMEGKEARARDVVSLPDGITMDIAGAYPEDAELQHCFRSFSLKQGTLLLTDEIECNSPKPVTWVFMLRWEPELDAVRQCAKRKDGSFVLDYSAGEKLSARVECMEMTDKRIQKSYPGKLWRLMLTAQAAAHHKQSFVFSSCNK